MQNDPTIGLEEDKYGVHLRGQISLTGDPQKTRMKLKSLPTWIVLAILVSLFLNTWGIDWGLPLQWNPDEEGLTGIAERMVDQRTLNPHSFVFGSLHYYELIVFSEIPVRAAIKALKIFDHLQAGPAVKNDRPRTTGEGIGSTRHDPYWIWKIRLARLYSAFLGTAIVVLVYLIGELLFGRRSGIIAAWLAALSMVLVFFSHFATVDISQTFWISLAFLFACCVWLKGSPVWSVLAGLTVGLAASVKYLGIIMAISLILGHLIRKDGRKTDLMISLLMVGVGVLIGLPVLVFSFFEFIDGFTKELFFHSARTAGQAAVFHPFLVLLKDALGWPLFLCSVGALVYTIRFLFSSRERPKLLLLWSAILPYWVLMTSHPFVQYWYALPLIPFLAVVTGKMVADLSECTRPPARAIVLAGFLVVIGYSAAYAISADLQLLRDSRVLARQWIIQHVAGGSKIEVRGRQFGDDLPEYVWFVRPMGYSFDFERSSIAGREQDRVYHFLRSAALALEQYGEKLGIFGKRKPYKSWPEAVIESELDREARTLPIFDLGMTGLEFRNPDYLMFVDVDSETLRSSGEAPFYDALFSGRTSYREAARFRFQLWPWLDTKLPFANPDVFLFEKTKRGAGD
jgi:hypothetical protein